MTNRKLPFAILALVACTSRQPGTVPLPVPANEPLAHSIIPLPASVELDRSRIFTVDSSATIYVDADADGAVEAVATQLAAMLAPAIGGGVRRLAAGASLPLRSMHLRIDPTNIAAGAEGYELTITPDAVTIVAGKPAGLFYAVQTVRQLLPVSIEHPAALKRRLTLPAGRIVDAPRFEWRGMMLDVSRHFLGVGDVKRFIDLVALYKINRLHLHLSDDQGWRIEIKSRPRLAEVGGSTQVGGGAGGYYTQPDYSEIVAYAASRFITIVPEIDMPGHTNAALASYPELNCNNVAPPLYTGIRVGFSAVCVDSAKIYPILEDVVREISSLTPGAFFHIGGDEVKTLSAAQYRAFVERMQGIVNANGKRMIGWGEIAPAQLSAATVVQSWIRDSSAVHAARGGRVILSPATKIYLDMKYDSTTVLGLSWAGLSSVRNAYDWDPATFIPGVTETSVLGVEAPLWSETLIKAEDFESMAFPRLIAVAEVGWTRMGLKGWDDFRRRLEGHAPRLNALGVNAVW
ncbi:MAG: beta-N-acetylhexosaminidase [Gemmatimonadota bacterium]|nr:beta-N-acetylhexosaminidase [Gemmatimonadota bacterium]